VFCTFTESVQAAVFSLLAIAAGRVEWMLRGFSWSVEMAGIAANARFKGDLMDARSEVEDGDQGGMESLRKR
jgi:hypothetical protein